jgi:hypothetical protein
MEWRVLVQSGVENEFCTVCLAGPPSTVFTVEVDNLLDLAPRGQSCTDLAQPPLDTPETVVTDTHAQDPTLSVCVSG